MKACQTIIGQTGDVTVPSYISVTDTSCAESNGHITRTVTRSNN